MQIPREKAKVFILTANHKITGDIYLPPNARLTDYMNSRSTNIFFPLTEVSIFNISDGKMLLKCNFLNINAGHVIAITNELEPEA